MAARPYRAWLLSESDARQHRPREGGLTVLTATLDVTFPKGLPQIAGTQKETAVPRKLVLGERCGGGKGLGAGQIQLGNNSAAWLEEYLSF